MEINVIKINNVEIANVKSNEILIKGVLPYSENIISLIALK